MNYPEELSATYFLPHRAWQKVAFELIFFPSPSRFCLNRDLGKGPHEAHLLAIRPKKKKSHFFLNLHRVLKIRIYTPKLLLSVISIWPSVYEWFVLG